MAALHVYPIKSCRGLSVESVALDSRGIALDRRWMVVSAADGLFLSLRTQPELAHVSAEPCGDDLKVSAPGTSELRVHSVREAPVREVRVWRDSVDALDCGDEAAAWFSDVLRRPCRLVQFDERKHRPLDAKYSPRPEAETAFADGYPVLVTNTASLESLNARLSQAVSMARFRPNIVVEGAEAFEEERWERIRVGTVEFDVVKPCSRCVVVDTDEHGVRRPGLLAELTRSHFREGLGAIFGQNAVPRAVGSIHVGDTVEIVASRGH